MPMQSLLTDLLRVPAEPDTPFGAPGSLRVFRAARPFLYYRLVGATLRQAGALVGLLLFLSWAPELDPAEWAKNLEKLPHEALAKVFHASNEWRLFDLLEAFALIGFFVQLPFAVGLAVLDYRYRWYLVTDRSLRIREGVLRLNERTMTFSNLQHVTIRQGPVQRLLGISDLEVRTAGGGDKARQESDQKQVDSFHIGRFRGVANAAEIRDLVLERLRRSRATELASAPAPVVAPTAGDAGAAARELLDEARALRRALRA